MMSPARETPSWVPWPWPWRAALLWPTVRCWPIKRPVSSWVWWGLRPYRDNNSRRRCHVGNDRAVVTVVIPARFGSSRFPGKPLVQLAGKPLIQHVYERIQGCREVQRIVVATDDPRIAEAVQRFGGNCVTTAESYRTGTDRVAGIARHLPGQVFVNVQGDEVILDPVMLDNLVAAFLLSNADI